MADVHLSRYGDKSQGRAVVGSITKTPAANDSRTTNAGQGFGTINSDVVAPTSPYGAFGSPGSGRVMVVNGMLTF
jgi:hypothetical protein